MSYTKKEISAYRVLRSKESLEEAKILSQTNHWNTVANRLYYGCFYIVSAYLVLKGVEASSHNGIKVGFNRDLIKTGKLEKKYGQLYNNLFNIRQDADYRDYKDVKEEKIKPMIEEVKELIKRIERIIKEEDGS